MAKMKTALLGHDDSIALGPVELPAAMLLTLAPEDANKNGIVLASDRIKFAIDVDGKIVNVVASIYIQRDALNDAEVEQVAKVATERQAARDKREKDEAEKLAREKQAAFELGQQSTMHAIRNVNEMTVAAQTLARLASK